MSLIQDGVRHLAFDNPFYNLSLGGSRVPALTAVPPDPWPGSAERGAQLLKGEFAFGGQTHRLTGDPLEERYWFPKGAGAEWHQVMQSFEWLRDLRAVGGDEARRLARNLVIGWLEWNALWSDLTWTPPLLGMRIANWIGTHDFFWASADEGLRFCVLDSLSRQTRHLARVVPGRLHGEALLQATKGLAFGSLGLTDGDACRSLALRLLSRALGKQLLPDGGHVSRCPSIHLHVLRHLIDIRAAFRAARAEVPDDLQQAIERMSPVLRTFRHWDGGLALFNGGREEEPALIEAVLTQADGRVRPMRSLPHMGFQRLAGGRALAIMDVGVPPQPGADLHAQAGALSFEFSVGKERMLVNCGAHPTPYGLWRQALAATAAHTTLVLNDTNSAEVLDQGGLGRRPTHVTCERLDLDDATMVVARHDGYVRPFGYFHRRRLWLSESGWDVRGEDMLEPAPGATVEPKPYVLRFHVHPSVQAALIEGGDTVRLVLPSGIAWQLHAQGHVLEIGESIYLGTGEPIPTLQVMLAGETRAETAVKWTLRRESEGTRAGELTAGPAA